MAAKKQPTNADLYKRLDGLQEQVAEVKQEVKEEFQDIRPKLEEVRKFMFEQIGYYRGQQSAKKDDGTIKVSKEVWGLIIKLVGFIGLGFAIIQALLGISK